MRNYTPLLLLLLLCSCLPLAAQIPCNGTFVTSGDATDLGGCIQLTPDETGQNGCAWLDTPVDFNEPFTHTMSAYFGDDDNGADGICLVYQPGGVGACGGQGASIGAAGIPNSFIVEFDTWDNGPPQGDIPPDHCAVAINGNLANQINGPVALANIEDGANHSITFSWDPATMIYTITFDGMPILSGMYDIVNNVFNGNNLAYWGYTSATGAADNEHLMCPVIPPPIVVDAGVEATVPCAEGVVTLSGTAPAGSNYTYSWSSPNGGQILSGGNTLNPTVQGPGTYVLTLTNNSGGCQEIDDVQVTIEPLLAVIDAPPFAPCAGGAVTLDGSGSSSGPFITYQWTTAGGTILTPSNQPIIQAGGPGQYTLTVTFNNGLGICTATTSIVLVPDPDVPIAVAFADTLDCANPVITINGGSSSTGGQYTYQWTTSNGQIVSGANTQFPLVGAAGDYMLTIVNTLNNCTAMTTVTVADDFDTPEAEANVSGPVDCNNPTVTLSAAGSTTGSNISYTWLTDDGNIVSGANAITAIANTPGEYTLFVENTENSCFEAVTVEVLQGQEPPEVEVAQPETYTCAQTSIPLSAAPMSPAADLVYEWFTMDGSLNGEVDTLTATATSPGLYILTTTDTSTGCVVMDSVLVPSNTVLPMVEAGDPLVLSCGQTSATLSGIGSSEGMPYTYQWSSSNGSVLSGGTSLSPVVGSAGLYLLEVTDSRNGCSALDSVAISSDVNLPPIQIAMPDTLDCAQTSLQLDASASAQGAPYVSAWSSANGQFVSGTEGLTPTVDAPGIYTLSITDTTNACEAISTIEVLQDTISPSLSVVTPDTLNCALTSLPLDASGSDQGGNFSYSWTGDNSQAITGADTPMPIVSEPGIYELEVTNTQNQCQSSVQIEVVQDTMLPVLQIAPPPTLNCTLSSFELDATASSSGFRYVYGWTGTVDSGENTLMPTVSQAGTYLLTILDVQNLCSRTDSVEVAIDTLAPLISAGADQLINCYTPALMLPGSGTGDDSRWLTQWSTPDGQILSGANMLTPSVDSAGTYVLSVTDTINGCQSLDTLAVTSDFAEPMVAIASPDLLTCTDTLLTLSGVGSSTGASFAYSWQHDSGGIQSGADGLEPTISQSGTYRLTVTNTTNGCIAVDSVEVQQDVNVPVAAIEQPEVLNCNTASLSLNATSSSQGLNISLAWDSNEGNILSGADGLQPVVDAAGTYTLTVLDTLNNCQSIASVQVAIDTIAPLAEAGDALLLNCYQPTAALDGNASATGPQMIYNWSTPGGNLLGDTQSLAPTVDTAGTYYLQVTNTDNGCQSIDSTIVDVDFEAPVTAIAMPGILTCTDTTLTLNGSASSTGSNFAYQWSNTGDGILSGGNTTQALIQAPGQYVLEVQNLDNGCLNTDTVMVQEDVDFPLAQIAPPAELNCSVPNITLDAAGSSSGNGFEISWSTDNGQILSGNNDLQADVNAAGLYVLSILNQNNNCLSTATVEVDIDTLPPVADAGLTLALNCAQPAATLDGSGSTIGTDISYSWTTTDGNIISDSTTLAPLVDEAGTYELIVFNADNGCSSSAMVEVSKDVTEPTAQVPVPDTLTCAQLMVDLNASASFGESLSYQWSTSDGQIASGQNDAVAAVDAPGTYELLLTNTFNFCRDTLQVVVAQDTISPSGQIQSPPILNCMLTQTPLIANVNGDYTFSWETDDGTVLSGSDGPQAVIADPGLYTLDLFDPANGCSQSLSVTVQQDTLSPMAQIAAPLELNCEQTSITIDASTSSTSPDLSYQWSSDMGSFLSGADGLEPQVDAPGDYQLLILNTVNFCADSLSVAVTQDTIHPTLSIALPDTLDCVTPEVSLNGSSVGSSDDFTYTWSSNGGLILDGANAATASVGAPGQYAFEVTDLANNCRSVAMVQVEQDTVAPQAIITTADTLDCDVAQVTLDGSASSSGSVMAYAWTSPSGNTIGNPDTPAANTDSPGTYQLLVVNTQNGCRDSAMVSVLQDTLSPTVLIAEPSILNCAVNSVPLVASGSDFGPNFTLDWSGPAGGFANGTDSLTPEVVAPGNYSLTIENTDNGCVSMISVSVSQDTMAPLAEAGADFVISCFPDLRQLDGSASSTGAPYSYSWSTDNGILEGGTNTLTPTIDGPGSYTLSIFNSENGCSSTDVVVVSQDIPVAEASLVQPPCFGDAGQLQIMNVNGGTAPYVYSVDGGGQFQSSPSFLTLPPGEYEWVVQDVQGCEDRATVIVEQPDSLIIRVVPEEVELQLGDSLAVLVQSNFPFEDLVNITWQPAPGLSCYDCLQPVARPTETTDYYLTVSTAAGCSGRLRLRVYVDKGSPIFIPNVFSPNNDGSNDFFYPQAKPGVVRNIRDFHLFNRWGESVFQRVNFLPNDPTAGWDGSHRGERLNSGVFAYYLEVEFIDGRVELLKGDVVLMR
jgi:gliding motility-associated-like protein